MSSLEDVVPCDLQSLAASSSGKIIRLVLQFDPLNNFGRLSIELRFIFVNLFDDHGAWPFRVAVEDLAVFAVNSSKNILCELLPACFIVGVLMSSSNVRASHLVLGKLILHMLLR